MERSRSRRRTLADLILYKRSSITPALSHISSDKALDLPTHDGNSYVDDNLHNSLSHFSQDSDYNTSDSEESNKDLPLFRRKRVVFQDDDSGFRRRRWKAKRTKRRLSLAATNSDARSNLASRSTFKSDFNNHDNSSLGGNNEIKIVPAGCDNQTENNEETSSGNPVLSNVAGADNGDDSSRSRLSSGKVKRTQNEPNNENIYINSKNYKVEKQTKLVNPDLNDSDTKEIESHKLASNMSAESGSLRHPSLKSQFTEDSISKETHTKPGSSGILIGAQITDNKYTHEHTVSERKTEESRKDTEDDVGTEGLNNCHEPQISVKVISPLTDNTGQENILSENSNKIRNEIVDNQIDQSVQNPMSSHISQNGQMTIIPGGSVDHKENRQHIKRHSNTSHQQNPNPLPESLKDILQEMKGSSDPTVSNSNTTKPRSSKEKIRKGKDTGKPNLKELVRRISEGLEEEKQLGTAFLTAVNMWRDSDIIRPHLKKANVIDSVIEEHSSERGDLLTSTTPSQSVANTKISQESQPQPRDLHDEIQSRHTQQSDGVVQYRDNTPSNDTKQTNCDKPLSSTCAGSSSEESELRTCKETPITVTGETEHNNHNSGQINNDIAVPGSEELNKTTGSVGEVKLEENLIAIAGKVELVTTDISSATLEVDVNYPVTPNEDKSFQDNVIEDETGDHNKNCNMPFTNSSSSWTGSTTEGSELRECKETSVTVTGETEHDNHNSGQMNNDFIIPSSEEPNEPCSVGESNDEVKSEENPALEAGKVELVETNSPSATLEVGVNYPVTSHEDKSFQDNVAEDGDYNEKVTSDKSIVSEDAQTKISNKRVLSSKERECLKENSVSKHTRDSKETFDTSSVSSKNSKAKQIQIVIRSANKETIDSKVDSSIKIIIKIPETPLPEDVTDDNDDISSSGSEPIDNGMTNNDVIEDEENTVKRENRKDQQSIEHPRIDENKTEINQHVGYVPDKINSKTSPLPPIRNNSKMRIKSMVREESLTRFIHSSSGRRKMLVMTSSSMAVSRPKSVKIKEVDGVLCSSDGVFVGRDLKLYGSYEAASDTKRVNRILDEMRLLKQGVPTKPKPPSSVMGFSNTIEWQKKFLDDGDDDSLFRHTITSLPSLAGSTNRSKTGPAYRRRKERAYSQLRKKLSTLS